MNRTKTSFPSSPRPPLTVASLGGFGHSSCVFDDMLTMGNDVRLTAMAPVYREENITGFSAHPIVSRDNPALFSNTTELLSRARPDVAVISTRLDLIANQVIDALAAGCHVIAEKPLAIDLPALRQIHEQWLRSECSLTAMLSMRSLPAFVIARDVYRQGAIGEVVAANARKSYKWGMRPEWFADRSKYGGTFPWVGIHALDMIHFVTGQRFVEAAAMQANRGHSDFPGCEDVCAGIFRMEGGGMATVSVDLFRPHSAQTYGDDWCRIVGTRGVIEANASQGWCRLHADDSSPRELPLPKSPDPIFARFLQGIRNDLLSTETALTAFHLTDACLTARDSAESKQFLPIAPDCWNCPG